MKFKHVLLALVLAVLLIPATVLATHTSFQSFNENPASAAYFAIAARGRIISPAGVASVSAAKTDFEDARRAFRGAISADVDAQVEARETLRIKAKELLRTRVTVMKQAIESMVQQGLPISETDAEVTGIDETETNIESAPDAQALVRHSKALARGWQRVMHKALAGRARAINQNFIAAIGKASAMVTRIESAVTSLKSQGKDTVRLEAGLTRIKSDLTKLESIHTQLKTEFEAAQTDREKAVVLLKAKRFFAHAHQRLRLDFQIVRKMVVAIRVMSQSASDTAVANAQTELETLTAQIETQKSLDEIFTEVSAQAETEVTVSETDDEGTGGDAQ